MFHLHDCVFVVLVSCVLGHQNSCHENICVANGSSFIQKNSHVSAILACQDDNGDCAYWASIGECDRNAAYMHSTCKMSCGKCAASCGDANPSCGYWAARGDCGKNPAYMRANCQKSCNICNAGNQNSGSSGSGAGSSRCAPFSQWPSLDDKTCSDCTALVQTGPYGGRCDAYCQSFGHSCVRAAEEMNDDCAVKYTASCSDAITGTSDMLCTCHKGAGGSGSTARPSYPVATGDRKIKVVSYNLYWWNAFGQNPSQGQRVTDNIKNKLRPDVLGMQECDSPSLIQQRTGYVPASRFAGTQGVSVKPNMFTVLQKGYRDIQATGKWGPRYVTWAQLRHPSGHTFWHFNTHWCVHSGNGRTCSADKRYTGAKNMLAVIQEKAQGSPAIITGDFNAGMGEPGPKHFLQNGFSLAANEWVDAIFVSNGHWTKVSSGRGDKDGSDHHPVIAELEF